MAAITQERAVCSGCVMAVFYMKIRVNAPTHVPVNNPKNLI